MSLMPRSRLIIDSPRSPSVAVTASASPNGAPCHQESWNTYRKEAAPNTVQPTSDPANPSIDFFGLTVGASGCLPRNTPVAYPAVSLQTTAAMNAMLLVAPSCGCAIRMANPARNGTYMAIITPVAVSRRYPVGPSASRHTMIARQVRRNATASASGPRSQASASIAASPANSGTSGGLASTLATAPASSQAPTPTATTATR